MSRATNHVYTKTPTSYANGATPVIIVEDPEDIDIVVIGEDSDVDGNLSRFDSQDWAIGSANTPQQATALVFRDEQFEEEKVELSSEAHSTMNGFSPPYVPSVSIGIPTEHATVLHSQSQIYDETDALNSAAIQAALEEDYLLYSIHKVNLNGNDYASESTMEIIREQQREFQYFSQNEAVIVEGEDEIIPSYPQTTNNAESDQQNHSTLPGMPNRNVTSARSSTSIYPQPSTQSVPLGADGSIIQISEATPVDFDNQQQQSTVVQIEGEEDTTLLNFLNSSLYESNYPFAQDIATTPTAVEQPLLIEVDGSDIQYARAEVFTEHATVLESAASIYDDSDALNAAAIQRILDEDSANQQSTQDDDHRLRTTYAEATTNPDNTNISILERKPAAKSEFQRTMIGYDVSGIGDTTSVVNNVTVSAEIIDIHHEIDIHPDDDSLMGDEIVVQADLISEGQNRFDNRIQRHQDAPHAFVVNGCLDENNQREGRCHVSDLSQTCDFDGQSQMPRSTRIDASDGIVTQKATSSTHCTDRTKESSPEVLSSARRRVFDSTDPSFTVDSDDRACSNVFDSIAVAEIINVRTEEDIHPDDSSVEDDDCVHAELVSTVPQSTAAQKDASSSIWNEGKNGTRSSKPKNSGSHAKAIPLHKSANTDMFGSRTPEPGWQQPRSNGDSQGQAASSPQSNRETTDPTLFAVGRTDRIQNSNDHLSDELHGRTKRDSSQSLDWGEYNDGKGEFGQGCMGNEMEDETWNDTINIGFVTSSTGSTVSSLSSRSFSNIQSMSRNITSGTSNVMGVLFGDAKTPFLKKSSTPAELAAANVSQRELLPWNVIKGPHPGMWLATVQTNQKAHEKNSPQDVSKGVWAFSVPSKADAQRLAIAFAPPRMLPFSDFPHCHICRSKFALLRRACHCRNCGVCVCKECSLLWSGKMIPETYNFKRELSVNICKSCDWLSNAFRLSLLDGDYDRSVALIATGNINLFSPFANVKGELFYPVHCATLGGNLKLLKFLVEDSFCPISKELQNKATPLLTSKGRSLLRIALEKHNVPIVHYLVVEKGVSLFAEKDISSDLLRQNLTYCLQMLPSDAAKEISRTEEVSTASSPLSINEFTESAYGFAVADDVLEKLDAGDKIALQKALFDESVNGGENRVAGQGTTEECIICYESAVDCVGTPCGHQMCCLSCSERIKKCPVCSAECTFIRIFKT